MSDNPFAVQAKQPSSAGVMAQREVAAAMADIQSALVVAKKFPRDPRVAMDAILADCKRVSLAELAVYEYARGKESVSGASIRLAEVIAQRWGNILCGVREIARHDGHSEAIAFAWDLETNFRDEKTFTVRHWRDTRKGGYPVTEERDIYELVANMGARRKRACILAVIPKEVEEAAVYACEKLLVEKGDDSPEAKQKMVEAFAQHGVTLQQIEDFLQRKLDAFTPRQMTRLRKIYASLRDGMSGPDDWFSTEPQAADIKRPKAATPPPSPADPAPPPRADQAQAPPADPAPSPHTESPPTQPEAANSDTGPVDAGGQSSVGGDASASQKPAAAADQKPAASAETKPATKTLIASQVRILKARADDKQIAHEDVAAFAGAETIEQIPFEAFNAVAAWIREFSE